MATGLQDSFSWAGVAAAGVGAGLGRALGGDGSKRGTVNEPRHSKVSKLARTSAGKQATGGGSLDPRDLLPPEPPEGTPEHSDWIATYNAIEAAIGDLYYGRNSRYQTAEDGYNHVARNLQEAPSYRRIYDQYARFYEHYDPSFQPGRADVAGNGAGIVVNGRRVRPEVARTPRIAAAPAASHDMGGANAGIAVVPREGSIRDFAVDVGGGAPLTTSVDTSWLSSATNTVTTTASSANNYYQNMIGVRVADWVSANGSALFRGMNNLYQGHRDRIDRATRGTAMHAFVQASLAPADAIVPFISIVGRAITSVPTAIAHPIDTINGTVMGFAGAVDALREYDQAAPARERFRSGWDNRGNITSRSVADASGRFFGHTAALVATRGRGTPFRSVYRSPIHFRAAERGVAVEARGGAYVLRDAEGSVVRSGRSGNLTSRAADHRRDPLLKDYDFDPVYRTDVYAEQRGLEQILHDTYQPPLNRIRPISPTNPNRQIYNDAAQKYLGGN